MQYGKIYRVKEPMIRRSVDISVAPTTTFDAVYQFRKWCCYCSAVCAVREMFARLLARAVQDATTPVVCRRSFGVCRALLSRRWLFSTYRTHFSTSSRVIYCRSSIHRLQMRSVLRWLRLRTPHGADGTMRPRRHACEELNTTPSLA